MTAIRDRAWLLPAVFLACITTGLADTPSEASGGDVVLVDPQPQPWGGTQDTAMVIGSNEVLPPNDTVTWQMFNGVGLFQTSATPIDWYRLIHLPSGALLQRVEIEACDTSTTAEIQFGLKRGSTPGGTPADISIVGGTGVGLTPGCAFFSVPTNTNPAVTVNNALNDYWVFFNWTGSNFLSAIRLQAIRVYYRLQVSPAPFTATFPDDVPTTHPFYRFVEALARSGVTGGCGTGSFCPDAPVTRGQMAVFLSALLGLHTAP